MQPSVQSKSLGLSAYSALQLNTGLSTKRRMEQISPSVHRSIRSMSSAKRTPPKRISRPACSIGSGPLQRLRSTTQLTILQMQEGITYPSGRLRRDYLEIEVHDQNSFRKSGMMTSRPSLMRVWKLWERRSKN